MTVAEDLLAIADRASSYDGVEPFSEQTRLALRHSDPQHVIRTDGVVTAGAYVADDGAVELVVDPDSRRHGYGTRIVQGVLEQRPDARFWAHGDLPGAQAVASTAKLTVVRNLWQMGRDTNATPAIESPEVPKGFTVRSFRHGDEENWLDLNRRAFDYHPEQGKMTRQDLDERMAEPWWNPAGLILIFDDATGELAASHWTKIEDDEGEVTMPAGASSRASDGGGAEANKHSSADDTASPRVGSAASGEVYVVAVDPGHQGQGLGKVVTALGLAHLKQQGVGHIELYVEGDNAAAVATYRRLGFERTGVDVMYAVAG
ncbi:mycothiol acetyltransferase [Flexivirga endophytica]|uniref:Mycothiol acetyltransferase n=1 Tax=Flexivirga endophytica TaxID=1849103 RepID=A0A916X0C5_9MICO|nr:mycothiol synthase [Flexivirga endophytica]GGB43431.1 mycothiol acetyltransferase [Flexivirga endophytica]GHB68419.1 mycothiol acetyltransferase [Flexivirga endophytica]